MNNKLKNGIPYVKTGGKEWPNHNKMAIFADIADPVVKALKVAMKKNRAVYKDGIMWTGLKQGKLTEVTTLSPPATLHAKNLSYSKSDQGRDVFTEIVAIAVQLGMEQGRRTVIKELKEYSFLFTSKDGKAVIEHLIKD